MEQSIKGEQDIFPSTKIKKKKAGLMHQKVIA